YYETYLEFLEALRALEHNRWLSGTLGRNGRQFFRDHYDWPVRERKYLEMFERVPGAAAGKAMDPLPGWLERRRQNLPPAAEVLARLPRGRSRPARDNPPPRRAARAQPPAASVPPPPRQSGREERERWRQSPRHRR